MEKRKINRLQCAICGLYLSQITDKHLRRHGMTIEEYEERFGARDIDTLTNKLRETFTKEDFAELIVSSLSREELVDAIASADLRVFPTKAKMQLLIEGIMTSRMRLESSIKSGELLAAVRESMKQQVFCRTDGEPPSIKELKMIADIALADIRIAADTTSKMNSLIVHDNRVAAAMTVQGAGEGSFSGEKDKLPNISGHEREKVRLLMEKLVSEVEKNKDAGKSGKSK